MIPTTSCMTKPLFRIRSIRDLRVLLCVAGIIGATTGQAAKTTTPPPDDLLLPVAIVPPAVTNPPLPAMFADPIELASELRAPDGIARDAETGDVYVSEEDLAHIVRIRPDGTRQVVFDGTTPLYEGTGASRKRAPGLRGPEGLALAGKGILYVVEDVPGGRLIAFDLRGLSGKARPSGKVVPLPLEGSQFAWEAVDVGPSGEMLLAGSTMEAFLSGTDKGGVFRGAILYRDAEGEWWMPMNHAMVSYSAVCFSRKGNYAFFACEVTGAIGCLDLRSNYLRTWHSSKTFHSPEGLCALPGGGVLVAEEGGAIYWLDPTADDVQMVHAHPGGIESLLWDELNRRLYLTDDRAGKLVAMEPKYGMGFRSSIGTAKDVPFEKRSTPVDMIPSKCPDYLAKVLELGGYNPHQEGGKLAFRDFARRYCLIAIDAETRLIPKHKPVEDPIRRIQFVIVAPYLIGYQEGDLIWSSSGFAVVKESGQTVKTGLVKRQIIHGDLLESRFTPVGGQTIALPMPFSARVNAEGFVSVNFMGMGVTPDFYLVLDANDPDQSVMVVIQPDGFVQQYQVRLPANRDRNRWVIALERKEPDVWKRLTPKP